MDIAMKVVSTIVVAGSILLLCGCQQGMLSVHRDLDINSGDVSRLVFILHMQVGARIDETPFSREVRRLGIHTEDTRAWRPMSVRTLTSYCWKRYDGAINDCNFLVQMLALMKMADEERSAILEKALSNLQTASLDDTDRLIYSIGERLREAYGLPPIPEEKRRTTFERYRNIR
jgi:hypothetical protein